MTRREAAAGGGGGGAPPYRYPAGSDSPAPPPPRDVRTPQLRAKRGEGRASGRLLAPSARMRSPTALAHRAGRGGARRRSPKEGHILSPGSFPRWEQPGGSSALFCRGRPALGGREGGAAARPGSGGGTGICLLRRLPAARRGTGGEGSPRLCSAAGSPLEPGRSGAGASPSVTLCAVWGRKCRRRSPGRFSSTQLRMDPPSTGPALPSE